MRISPLFVAIVLVICSAVSVEGQGPLRSTNDLQARVDAAVKTWSSTRSTFVTPRLIPELMSGTGQFQTVYCYPSNPQAVRAQCEKLLSSQEQYNSAVADFLNQLSGPPRAEIKSLFALLAAAIGSTAGASGWPETQPNHFWSVEISSAHSSLIVDVSGTPLEAGNARTVILPTGTTRLLEKLVDGRQLSLTAAWTPGAGAPNIQMEPTNASTAVAVTPTIIEPDVNTYCPDWKDVTRDAERRPEARGDRVISSTPPQRAAFSSARGVEVHVNSESLVCDDTCHGLLGSAFVQAISLWRSGCSACEPFLFAVLRIGSDVHVDTQVVEAFQYAKARGISAVSVLEGLTRGTAPAEFAANALTRIFYGNSRRPITGYLNLSTDPAIRNLLCGPGASGFVLETACRATCPSCMSITVATVSTGTSCGNQQDIIACGTPDRKVELNVRDFRFQGTFPAPAATPTSSRRAFAFGHGGRSVDLSYVLVHEAAHFFGLSHVDDPPAPSGKRNILNPSYTTRGFCVTPSGLTMVSRAASLDWSYRIKDCSGLRYQ